MGWGTVDRALNMSFDFDGKAGYAIARKSFPLGNLTGNWAISFRVRGEMRPNTLEFKLLDSSGENVWWHTIAEFQPTTAWRTLVIRQRQVTFAWGPAGGGSPRDIAAVEIVVTAGQGGRGTLGIDDLIFTSAARADVPVTSSVVVASAGTLNGSNVQNAVDGDTTTVWSADYSAPNVDRSRQPNGQCLRATGFARPKSHWILVVFELLAGWS